MKEYERHNSSVKCTESTATLVNARKEKKMRTHER